MMVTREKEEDQNAKDGWDIHITTQGKT